MTEFKYWNLYEVGALSEKSQRRIPVLVATGTPISKIVSEMEKAFSKEINFVERVNVVSAPANIELSPDNPAREYDLQVLGDYMSHSKTIIPAKYTGSELLKRIQEVFDWCVSQNPDKTFRLVGFDVTLADHEDDLPYLLKYVIR